MTKYIAKIRHIYQYLGSEIGELKKDVFFLHPVPINSTERIYYSIQVQTMMNK